MTLEQPPRGEPQANGTAEEAGRTEREQARVLKLQVEAHICRKVAPGEPIMPWLMRWVALGVSRYQMGTYGNSPYERQTGECVILQSRPLENGNVLNARCGHGQTQGPEGKVEPRSLARACKRHRRNLDSRCTGREKAAGYKNDARISTVGRWMDPEHQVE